MKINSFVIAILIIACSFSWVFAGGGACQFQENGLPLLKQSPGLAGILTSTFQVKNGGKMGPMNAPFDRGRLYTYMEFQAFSAENNEQKFRIRLHFKRGESGITFKSIEILPLKDLPKSE